MKTPKLEQRGTPIQIDPQKGETIEMKVRRITQNKEPITDVAQPIYMERGVKMASCDIRTDRWEVAREAITSTPALLNTASISSALASYNDGFLIFFP